MTQLLQNAFRILHACLHVYPAILRIPLRALVSRRKEEGHITRSWYLRLKQIECYQAFQADDKEYRTDAQALEAPRGDAIGKSSLVVSRALTPSHILVMPSYIASLTIIGWQQTCYYTPSKNLWELSFVPRRRTRGARVYFETGCFVTQVIL